MMIQLRAQRSGLGLEKSVVRAFMRRTFQIVTFLDASKTRSKILSQVARRGRYEVAGKSGGMARRQIQLSVPASVS